MLSISSLDAVLSRAVSKARFLRQMKARPGASPDLLRLSDEPALVAFLSSAPRYDRARDAVLADLIRAARARWSDDVRDVLLLAFLPSIRRVLNRVRETSKGAFEDDLADALTITLEVVRAYDPDRHSPHVQANVELRAFNVFYRQWQRDNQVEGAIATVQILSAHAHEPAADEAPQPLSLFPGVPNADEAGRLSPEDIRLGEQLLASFVEASQITPEEAAWVAETRLRGRTLTEVAADAGVDRRTVARHVGRATERIRDLVDVFFGPEMPVSPKG